jgi:hypothetical protein
MIDNYFYSNSIDVDAVLNDVSSRLPNALFANNRSEIYKVTIPAIEGSVKYAVFKFPDTVNPRHFVNGKESKTDDCEIVVGELLTAALVSSTDVEGYFVFCRHGDYYLVDRSDVETEIYIKVTTVRRDIDYMMDDVKLSLKNIYFGLLTFNLEQAYKSMSMFSDAVNNHVASNQRVLPLIEHDIEEEESYLL